MKKLLCGEHKYKILEIWEGTERELFSFRKSRLITYVLRCSKCGEINRRAVSLPLNAEVKVGLPRRRLK